MKRKFKTKEHDEEYTVVCRAIYYEYALDFVVVYKSPVYTDEVNITLVHVHSLCIKINTVLFQETHHVLIIKCIRVFLVIKDTSKHYHDVE